MKTKKTKQVEFCKYPKGEFVEYIYSNKDGSYIGMIFQDDDEEYLFKPALFFKSIKMGKGKCLKEIAERLIQLNYSN